MAVDSVFRKGPCKYMVYIRTQSGCYVLLLTSCVVPVLWAFAAEIHLPALRGDVGRSTNLCEVEQLQLCSYRNLAISGFLPTTHVSLQSERHLQRDTKS